MHDIFLSYSTVDRERLVPLVAALERQGWSVFWDHRSVQIGEKWREVIEAAVCECRCVLVVWSQASVKSKWVREEASKGSRRDVLLPIRVDDVLPPFGFGEDQAGNFLGWNGKTDYPEFIRLADRVRWLLERQVKLEAAETAEQERLAKEKTTADQKAREAAERQAKAKQEQVKREQAAAEEKARKDAAPQFEATKNTIPADDQKQDKPAKPLWKKLPFQLGMAVVAGTALYQAEITREVYVNDSLFKSRYEVSDKGTVFDKPTNLMWKQCSEGQSGKDCSGEAAKYTWDDAIAKFGKNASFAGYSDWRMPTKDEMKSLVYCSNGTITPLPDQKSCGEHYYQSPTIDQQAFPNTTYNWFWSSSPVAYGDYGAWFVDFYHGNGNWDGKDNNGQVRLVRSGQ